MELPVFKSVNYRAEMTEFDLRQPSTTWACVYLVVCLSFG